MTRAMTSGEAVSIATAIQPNDNGIRQNHPLPTRCEAIRNGIRAVLEDALMSNLPALEIADRNAAHARRKEHDRAAAYWASVKDELQKRGDS